MHIKLFELPNSLNCLIIFNLNNIFFVYNQNKHVRSKNYEFYGQESIVHIIKCLIVPNSMHSGKLILFNFVPFKKNSMR